MAAAHGSRHPNKGGGVMDRSSHHETHAVRESEVVSSKVFEPDNETKASRRKEIIQLLRERGAQGVTKLEAPVHLMLSMSARIAELRKHGYRIDTIREEHGVGRYVLLAEPTREAA